MAADYRDPQYNGLPRGIRNNNPGNIKADGTQWQGMTGNDGTFNIFADMTWGTRALAQSLSNMIREGKDTITSIITEWAPPSDNNDDTAYISSVSSDTGIDPGAILSVDPQTLALLVRAISNHENGDGPSTQYLTDQDIADGISKMSNLFASLAAAAPVYFQANPLEALGILAFAFWVGYTIFGHVRRNRS